MATQHQARKGLLRGDSRAIARVALFTALCATPALALGTAQAGSEQAAATAPAEQQLRRPVAPVPAAQPARTSGKSTVQIIGHRGAPALAPENTLRGIALALRAGAAAVEFDVNFTSDRKIVLLHDFELDRTTNCSGVIHRTHSRALRACRTQGGHRIPTLQAALAEVARHGGAAYVHVKRATNPREAAILVQAVRASAVGKSATMIASHPPILERLRAAGARRLGYVFSGTAGWDTRYPVLIPFNTTINRNLVARAHRRGQFVVAVESRRLDAQTVRGLKVNGFMANDIEHCMWTLAGSPPPIRDGRVYSEAPSGSGWTETRRIRHEAVSASAN